MSSFVSNPLLAEAAPDMGRASKLEWQGGGVAEADPPGADQPDLASSQPAMSTAGPTSTQPDSISQSDEEGSKMSLAGSIKVQLDMAEHFSADGEDVHPQAAGVSNPQPPVLAGEAVAAQPDPSSSSNLFPSTATQPIDCTVDTVPMPDCNDASAVEAAAPKAEDPCQAVEQPGQHTSYLTITISPDYPLDSSSSTVKYTDKGDVAANNASGSLQLEAEAAADASPLQPAQKLSVPPSTPLVPADVAPGPVALLPAAISAAAPDQGDRSCDEGASPAVSGSQVHEPDMGDGLDSAAEAMDMTQAGASQMLDGWGEAAPAVEEPSLWSVPTADSSFKGKKNRRWKPKAKVSCTAQPSLQWVLHQCWPSRLDKAPSFFKPARQQG